MSVITDLQAKIRAVLDDIRAAQALMPGINAWSDPKLEQWVNMPAHEDDFEMWADELQEQEN